MNKFYIVARYLPQFFFFLFFQVWSYARSKTSESCYICKWHWVELQWQLH